MRTPLPALLLLLLASACSPPIPPPAPPTAAPDSAPRMVATPTTVVRATDATVDVALAGPSRVLYSPATMRAPRPSIRVVIANPSSRPLDVSDLRVRLDVTRGSQRVRCEESRGDEATRRREPALLQPGASFVWMRNVDCPLALAGSYVVQVIVAFGRAEPFASGIVTKELALTVAAPPDAQPRAVASVPGLHAAIGSGGLVASTTSVGRIVVALVNAGNERIVLPPMRVATRVRRVGTDIPCEDEPAQLVLPPALEGGAVITRPVDVSCLGLGVTGTYDVEARLLVADEHEAHPIGTLRIDVSADPSHRNRRPWP